MKPVFFAFIALMALAACGADGNPTPPAAKTGASVSGDVQIGVKG